MKSLKKISLVAATIMFVSFASFASDDPSAIVKKAIEAVENADESDWETLAQSAEICFMKNENVEQAEEWLDKSLKIKETPYNLELKGDHLRSNGKRHEATKCYYKAIIKTKEADPSADNSKLQQKIWDLR